MSLSAGYLYRFHTLRRDAGRAEVLRLKATTIQKLVITSIYPVTLTVTFWNLEISSGTLVLFPLFGVCSHFIGGLFALIISRCLHHNRNQTGAMLTTGAFTNLASFGGLVSYMYLGEAGYALATLFRLFEPVIYYCVGFPLARLYSSDTPPGTKWRFDLSPDPGSTGFITHRWHYSRYSPELVGPPETGDPWCCDQTSGYDFYYNDVAFGRSKHALLHDRQLPA